LNQFAELHVHLEGTITPEIACELNHRLDLEEARSVYAFDDFRGFIRAYIWANEHIKGPTEYVHVLRRQIEAFQKQGVVYAELNLSAGMIIWRELDFAGIFDALAKEADASPVRIRWIFDAVRQFGEGPGMRIAELAAARRDRGVIGFGFGGDENRGPAEWFKDVGRFALEQGLRVLPHAGEIAGPESIWAALECGASRIGHGIRAIDDPILVRHLSDKQIPLEVSITSNLCTGAVRSLAEHPVRRLFDAGVPITLNTDDPGFFRTSLQKEYRLARDVFGFGEAELDVLRENAFRFAVDAA
jgi:aminodeoxyfutalosine deaminase